MERWDPEMPIRIRRICKHCGQPIHQDDHFGPWFHDGPANERSAHAPMPIIEVVKRAVQG